MWFLPCLQFGLVMHTYCVTVLNNNIAVVFSRETALPLGLR